MIKVLATGVFDIIHPGHIYFLEQSRKLGDHLTVLITSDNVAKVENKRPIFNQQDRKLLIQSLKCVDEVVIGPYPYNISLVLKENRPDIIVLGYDQYRDIQKLSKDLVDVGYKGKIVRIDKFKNFSTSKIKNNFDFSQKV